MIVSIHCDSQEEAFRAAKAADGNERRPPVLHRGSACSEEPALAIMDADGGTGNADWHYHPACVDIQRDGQTFMFSYIFTGGSEQEVRLLDHSLARQL